MKLLCVAPLKTSYCNSTRFPRQQAKSGIWLKPGEQVVVLPLVEKMDGYRAQNDNEEHPSIENSKEL